MACRRSGVQFSLAPQPGSRPRQGAGSFVVPVRTGPVRPVTSAPDGRDPPVRTPDQARRPCSGSFRSGRSGRGGSLRFRTRPRASAPRPRSLSAYSAPAPVSFANAADLRAPPWQNRTAGRGHRLYGRERTMSASGEQAEEAAGDLLATAGARALLSCPSCGSSHVAQVLGDNGGVSYVCTACGHSWS